MNFNLSGMPVPLRFRPETPMSDEELMRFCAENDFLRVERDANGEILVMTPAGNRTGRMNAAIIFELGAWAKSDGRGYFFDSNTGFNLPDGSMRSPDAAWVRASRWDAMSAEEKERFSHIAPDFIIELRSSSDRLGDLEAKMQLWVTNGVQLAWMIDPERRVVAVYRPGDGPEVLHDPSSVQGTSVVSGFELIMARIWD
jgi:Uma2 family endonuclease